MKPNQAHGPVPEDYWTNWEEKNPLLTGLASVKDING